MVFYFHPSGSGPMRTAVQSHLQALENKGVRNKIYYCNAFDSSVSSLRRQQVDAVILHNTFLCIRWSHLFYKLKWKFRWIRDLDCVKIAIPQDEYDHSEILDEWLYEWGISTIFSNFTAECRKILYPIMHDKADYYECFTGYIDEKLAEDYAGKHLPLGARPKDIVYRATKLPYWFGSHGQLKHRIGEIIAERALASGLICDISTRVEDTIVGNSWLDFLGCGRAVIGCESGSSVLDRRGEIKAKIQWLLREKTDLSFEEMSAHLPVGWNDYSFFAISPRHFEAIITKTCQILMEGRYDSVLEPDKHYVPIKNDFSNLDEVFAKLEDAKYLTEITERAYEEIYLSGKYTYRRFGREIERVIQKHLT
jgi:hypothetical protein